MVVDWIRAGANNGFRPLLRWLIRCTARDLTAETHGRSALVVAPHPDDETLGCGATIHRKRQSGQRVHVAFIADGRHSHRSPQITPDELARRREAEAIAACEQLGLTRGDLSFCRVEDTRVAAHHEQVTEFLGGLLANDPFDEIYIPSVLDRHADHKSVHRCVVEQLRGRSARPRVLEYPVWFWGVRPGLAWMRRCRRAAIVRTEGHLEAKRQALAAYRSQMVRPVGEPSWPVLGESFTRDFFRGYEVFFPIDVD